MQLSQAELSKEIRFVIDELAREADEKLPYSANVQDSFLEVMFWRLLRGLPDSSLSTRFRQLNKDQSFIERFNRIIKDNLSQNLKMKDLAEMLQVSRRTLSTKCTLLTGAPPAQAYMQVKIDIADQASMLVFHAKSTNPTGITECGRDQVPEFNQGALLLSERGKCKVNGCSHSCISCWWLASRY